jgi:hypothetical protein
MTLVAATCVVCGGETLAPVYAGTIPDGDPAVYSSASRRVAGHLPIVRCAGCGLMMTSPRDDDATLGRIYADLEDRHGDREDAAQSRSAADRLA